MLSALSTPRVVVDLPTLRANIAGMQELATSAGVRLRPHSKTHKSPVIAQWQLDAGAVGICCAKLGEAEVMTEAGMPDIRLPYPIHPSNAERVVALVDRTKLSIIVDDLEVAREWSSKMLVAGRQLDVLVKVDVGFHRCGVNPDAPEVAETIRQIAGLSGLNFCGLLSHAGQGYGAASADELAGIASQEIAILNGLAARLHEAGVGVAEISVGATPTARFVPDQAGATEMRPGNYVFFDRTQVGLEAARLDQCALTVMSMVVSRPAPDRVVFDAGSKMLTSDGARGFGAAGGQGLVFPALDAPAPDPSIVIERLSEEHAVARVPTSCPLHVGDRVRILPNHSCTVTNLADELLLAEGAEVVDRIRVAARGRTQ
jgi:D-serine deaminase-like pyridoxal phosphate-dependent protein